MQVKVVIVFMALMLSQFFALGKNSVRWEDGADCRKADYLYMEAQRQLALENNDAYYELLKRSYDLGGSEASVGQDLGFYYIVLGQGDADMTGKGMDLMDTYFKACPEDYYGSVLYGSLCERMGDLNRAMAVWEKLHEIYPDKIDVSIRLSDAYLSRAADSLYLSHAIKLLDDVKRREGPSLQITARKVIGYMQHNDTTSVLNEVRTLVRETPRSAETHVYAADVFMSFNETDSALVYYNRACEIDPSSGLAYYKRAEYYNEMGDSAAYDREVFRALELPDLELETKLEILTGFVKELYTDTLQQPRINELFVKLIDLYPHDQSVHDLYSSYLVAVNDYKSAAEQQEYVIDTDIGNVDRWRRLVSLYFSAREYELATNAAERAIRLFEDNDLLKVLCGQAALLADRPEKALVYLNQVIESDSVALDLKSQAYTVKGDILYKGGDVAGAIVQYETAIECDPSNAMAMNNCAYFMACEGLDLDKAAELSRKSLNIEPDNESSLDTYAWIMFKKRDYKEAKVFIDRALEKTDEPSAELYHHLGDIYFMCGQPDDALMYWKKAAELDPDDELLQKKISNKTYFYE